MGVFVVKLFLVFVTLSFAFGEMSNDMKVEEGNQRAVNATIPTGCCDKISRPSRPGTCPKFYTAMACDPCVNACKTDGDCPLPRKCCCHPGCGNSCVNVIYTMGG